MKFKTGSNWKTYDESSIPNAPIGESDPADNGRYLIVPYENLFIDDTQTASLTTLRWPELPESITDQTRIRITLSVRVFSSTPDLSGVVLDCNFLGKYTQTHRLQSNTNWTGPYECADDISLERWEEAKKDANNKRLARIELVASKSMSQTTEGSHFALRVAIADLQLKVKLDDVDEINIPFQYDTFDQHWTYRFETGSKNQELTKTDSLWSNPALISVPFKLASLHNFEKWIHPSPIQPNAEIEEKPQEPVTKYWYTDRSDTTIQLVSLQQEMLAKNQDLCFIFYYAASERTQLKVTMSRPDADFEMPADQTAKGKKEADKWIDAPLIHDKRTLVTLQPTLSNQRELDWHQVQICVKRDVLPAFADQSLPNGKYTLNLTSLIHEEDAKKRVVALSLVDANSIEMQKVIAHSLLSDWDDQGSQATVEWHRESISSHFQWVVRSTDEAVGKSKAQIELNRAANKHATGYNLVSDWIWLKDDRSADTSTEEIDESWMFEEDGLESNDRNTTTIEEETTTIESDGNVAKPLKQTLKFSFDDVEEKGASDDLELELNVRYCVHKGNLVILAQNEQLQIGKLLTKRLNCDDVNHPVVLRDNKVKISDAAKAKLKGQRVRFIVSIQIEEGDLPTFRPFLKIGQN